MVNFSTIQSRISQCSLNASPSIKSFHALHDDSIQQHRGTDVNITANSDQDCNAETCKTFVVIGSSPPLTYFTIFIVMFKSGWLIYIFAYVFKPVTVCICVCIACTLQLRCHSLLCRCWPADPVFWPYWPVFYRMMRRPMTAAVCFQ